MLASRPVTRRLVLIAIVLAVLAGLARIALHSYEVVADDFDQSPALPLLQHPEQVGIEHLESVSFPGDNATHLAAWYVAAKNRGAVILVHGTNTDRSSMVAEMRILSAAGFGVLAFDWPGHGVSDGSVRWRAPERHALEAAIDWLAARGSSPAPTTVATRKSPRLSIPHGS